MRKIMAIYDENEGYGAQLAETLSAMEEFPYTAVCFHDINSLRSFAETDPVALFLCRREDPEEVRKTPAGKMIYLTDVRGYPWIDRVPSVYMYQPVRLLIREILDKCREEEQDKTPEEGFQRIHYLGVASPVGRCGKTGFALTLGQLLSQNGRALYLSTEICSGLGELLSESESGNLSDLIYAMDNGNAAEELSRLVRPFHGLDMILPVKNPEDLFDTDPKKIRMAAETAALSGGYDSVILDFGNDLKCVREFLPILQILFVPGKKDEISEMKLSEFRGWLQRTSPRLRVEEVSIPFRQNFVTGRNYLEQLLWSEQGAFVRELLEKMN